MLKIKTNGKTWRADMNMGAALYLKEEFDMEVEHIKNTTTDYLKYAYACCRSCAVIDGKEFDIDFAKFCAGMDPDDFNTWFIDFLSKNQKAKKELDKVVGKLVEKKKAV